RGANLGQVSWAEGPACSHESKPMALDVHMYKTFMESLLLCYKHSHYERFPMARRARDRYAAPVRLNDRLANSQTKPRVALGVSPGFVAAIKAFEDVREVRRGDALAGVGDFDASQPVLNLGGYPNFSVRLVVLDCVGEEVRHH